MSSFLLKGNRFLADLCDADVLVHVVDATGQSDKDGNVLGKGETGTAPSCISVTLYLPVFVCLCVCVCVCVCFARLMSEEMRMLRI